MRILLGKYKNKLVPTLKQADYRPCTAKFRESLFSMITLNNLLGSKSFLDADILDLFAGTGILSFEALSRGAKDVTLVDNNPKYLNLIKKFASLIDRENDVHCRLGDACYLKQTDKKYDIVFIDPPYYGNLSIRALTSLTKNNYLKNNAIIVVKMEKTAELDLKTLHKFHLIKEKVSKNTKVVVLKYY